MPDNHFQTRHLYENPGSDFHGPRPVFNNINVRSRHVYGKYIINEWNINGFNSVSKPYNTVFKREIIGSLYSDFWILPETHCRENEILEIDNFTVFQVNRKVNDNNRRGSGGIAIIVNNSVLETHIIEGVFRGIDGQLGLKLKNNLNDLLLGIVGLYLPPDSYIYGQDAEHFFSEASVIWNDMTDCDLLIGAGDLNARTKDLKDYLPEIDGDLPIRSNPDMTKNAHGNNFVTFLKDNRAVILNGRTTSQFNNFTFVSTRGSSVPDYVFCPLEHYQYCKEMKVMLVRDVVNGLSIPPPPSLPDHSILSATFFTSHFDFPQSEQSSFEPFNHVRENPKNKTQRKNLKKIDETFLMSEDIKQAVLSTIARLENLDENQGNIDKLWGEVKELFLNEMKNLPNVPSTQNKKLKKTFRKAQPFWNIELGNLWNITCRAEKKYLNFVVTCHDNLPHKKYLHQEFKAAQTLFDKKFRYFKRKFNEKNQNDLLNLATENDIWEKLKS